MIDDKMAKMAINTLKEYCKNIARIHVLVAPYIKHVADCPAALKVLMGTTMLEHSKTGRSHLKSRLNSMKKRKKAKLL